MPQETSSSFFRRIQVTGPQSPCWVNHVLDPTMVVIGVPRATRASQLTVAASMAIADLYQVGNDNPIGYATTSAQPCWSEGTLVDVTYTFEGLTIPFAGTFYYHIRFYCIPNDERSGVPGLIGDDDEQLVSRNVTASQPAGAF